VFRVSMKVTYWKDCSSAFHRPADSEPRPRRPLPLLCRA